MNRMQSTAAIFLSLGLATCPPPLLAGGNKDVRGTKPGESEVSDVSESALRLEGEHFEPETSDIESALSDHDSAPRLSVTRDESARTDAPMPLTTAGAAQPEKALRARSVYSAPLSGDEPGAGNPIPRQEEASFLTELFDQAAASGRRPALEPSVAEIMMSLHACGPNCLPLEEIRPIAGESPVEAVQPDRRSEPELEIPEHLKPFLPSARKQNPQDWTSRINLHLHSTYSDGTMSPTDVINASYKAGLRVVALTDHDTVAGIPEALQAVQEINRQHPEDPMYLYTGIELSANEGVHIGAIALDIKNPKLVAHLEYTRVRRYKRAEVIVDYMNKQPGFTEKNIHVDMAEVAAKSKYSDGGTIEIPHIARVLIDKGLVKDEQEAYDKYITPAAVATHGIVKEDPTPQEMLDLSKDSGGLRILNHPYTIRRDSEAEKDKIASDIIQHGKDLGIPMGIEAYRPSNATSENGLHAADLRAARYLILAEKLAATVAPGADFHGFETHLNHLVVWMPKIFGEKIKDLLKEINDLHMQNLLAAATPGTSVTTAR